jgi:hypothetical protein
MENYFDTPDVNDAKSILALFETNKAQRKDFVDDILTRLDEGQVNPLVVQLQVKCMEDILTQLTSTDKEKNKNLEAAIKYKKHLAEAFTNYAEGQKSFSFHNATFRQMEAGSRWQYENTEDPVLGELYEQQEVLKKKIKERETFLQGLPEDGVTITDENTGQVVRIFRPYKTSTTTIAVNLK